MHEQTKPPKIPTIYRVIDVGGLIEEHNAMLELQPSLADLRAIVEPFLDGGRMERVRVLCPLALGYTDMFVDEMGLCKGLPRNEVATEVYRNNHMIAFPDSDPEDLPYIAGVAVLFARPVWG